MSGTPHDVTTLEELALLIEAVEDYAIFLLSTTGEIRSWNRGAARMMGYAASEVIGKRFSIFYPPVDLANDKPGCELAAAERDGRVEDEGWRIRKNGERFWVSTIITALRGTDGKLRGFAKVTRDLTARREADEQLRRSEEMFRLLVGSVKDYAIFILNPDGHIASWNEGARRIKGYEPSEIIGKHFSTFYTPEDLASRKPERELEIARAQGSVEDEGWRVRKDGTKFWANVIITAMYDERRQLRGFAKVTRDVTDRKQREEMQAALFEQREARLLAEDERIRAETSYRVAQEANRAKDEFLMTLSHELRTPMTAILGWARLLPSMSPQDPAFRDAIKSIAHSAQLQANIIDDVLDVSRIVSGKLRLGRENVNVSQLLISSLEAVRATADARMITLETVLAPSLGTIVGDATRLQQVMWNLLTNALKFTPKNGVVTVSARRVGSALNVSVSDNGEGIDPQFLPHVFEPFRQAENPNTRIHGGLGLGLSIVRYIVEAHGGTVSAESGGKGAGSTFTLTLPIGAVAAPPLENRVPAGHELPERTIDRSMLAGLQIIVVDDDRDSREMVRAVLRWAGAEVIPFASGQDMLANVPANPPDIIVSDIAMPEMDGYSFSKELRRHPGYGGVKMVALTAFPAAGAAAAEGAFEAFLSKPIDPYDLVESVAKIVRSQRDSSRT